MFIIFQYCFYGLFTLIVLRLSFAFWNNPGGNANLLFFLATSTLVNRNFAAPLEVVVVVGTVYLAVPCKGMECTFGILSTHLSFVFRDEVCYGAAPVTFPALVSEKSQHQILLAHSRQRRGYACRPSLGHAVVYSFTGRDRRYIH